MADTHKVVTKVWIEPGCIVCDACETDCPEVFDVQEETCVIRPEATKPDFTKGLTPTIQIAAEGCPVNVIKFETVEAEGPEPEEWKKVRAGDSGGGAAAGGHGTGDGKGAAVAAVASRAAPDPKWISLLESAHITGSHANDDLESEWRRSAKVPAGALKQYLPAGAPPDAQFAAMVGTGFVKPKPTVADRIRERTGELAAGRSGAPVGRRGFLAAIAAGWASMLFVFATFGAWFQAFMVPRTPIQPPTKVRVGKLSQYSEIGVYEDYKKDNIWIISLEEDGQHRVVALSTICTHLGCIPNWLPGAGIFKCPCHGSGYRMNGVNFEGPAPRPLERYALSLDDAGVLIVDKGRVFRKELSQWNDSNAYLTIA